MTVQEFYKAIGVDYERVTERLQNESFIKRYFAMFLRDDQRARLETALQNGDRKAAFEAAHTIKGVAMNLDLKPLIDTVVPIVEALRGECDEAMLENVREASQTFYRRFDEVCRMMSEVC